MSFLVAASRLHIVLIAGLGTLTYGWLMTGQHSWALGLVSALDWLVLDLGNKLSDLPEDLINNPAEARWVQRHSPAIALAVAALFGASLLWTALTAPLALVLARLAFQAGGVAYNFRVLPGLGAAAWPLPPSGVNPLGPPGRRRLKEIYAVKNASAALLFILSVVGYPLLAAAGPLSVTPAYVAAMSLFFFFFEMSFEVIYDFKDLAGDRAAGVPTYPVVHGERAGRVIFDLFVAAAAAALLGAYALGVVGFRELIICFAPALQAALFEPFARRGFRAHDTVLVTHAGSLQLAIYNAYVLAGLPVPP